jgi:selenocysteine lyase/cysteine desulfurase
MDPAALRAEFPVLARLAYLNSGTDGPLPAAAVAAARAELAGELGDGRAKAHFERRFELQAQLRAGYARVLGCDPAEVALTTSTSEGLGAVLAGMDLGSGDVIVTSDQEHPGLVGPLKAARDRGVKLRAVPFRELANAVDRRTTLVAASHVNWVTGQVAPAELAEAGVPVIFDGAQGAGAVPLDVHALGCAAYAAAGQKWLCGADGTGMLFVSAELRERCRSIAPSYISFEDTTRGLDSPLRADARRFDTPSLSREAVALSLAALGVLEQAGLDAVHARAAEQAAKLAGELAERGRRVAPRGPTTLVSWEDLDPEATRDRAAEHGVIIRNLPGTPYLRASVGAWNDDSDLERLLEALEAGLRFTRRPARVAAEAEPPRRSLPAR